MARDRRPWASCSARRHCARRIGRSLLPCGEDWLLHELTGPFVRLLTEAAGRRAVVHRGRSVLGPPCTKAGGLRASRALRPFSLRAIMHGAMLGTCSIPFTSLLHGVTGGSSLPGETKNDWQGPIGTVETNKSVWAKLARPRRTHSRAQKSVAGSH